MSINLIGSVEPSIVKEGKRNSPDGDVLNQENNNGYRDVSSKGANDFAIDDGYALKTQREFRSVFCWHVKVET